MATQPGVWGIDLGQCALKAIRVENIDGVVTATAFDYVEHPKILSQPDADADQLTREALEKFLKRNRLKGDLVAMSVPGQSGLARFVKLPPVEEKKIGDIVKFEAKQQIPFNLEEVVWDYQKIGSGVVADGFAMETEIGLFAIKREAVYRALQHFQEVEVEVHLVQMAPLALCNFVSYELLQKDATGASDAADEKGKKPCVVALDIGVEGSNLVVTDGERIIWQRQIAIGGNRFTRALTKELKLTFAKAEHLKRNATKSPDLRKILQALRPDLTEFGNELQKSLSYFTNAHRDANIQYMVGLGGAFRLPGLQKYLHERLQLEIRKFSRFERLAGDSVVTAPVFNDNLLTMPVAFGLAVQGLKLARLQTNLLPPEIRTERLVRAKKPWAVAAAAALLFGTGAFAYGYKMKHEAVESPAVQAAMEKAEQELANIAKKQKEYDDKLASVRKVEHDLHTIQAGKEEQVNWLALNKFVVDALPRPDLGEVEALKTQRPKELEYWASKGGKQAYEKHKARLTARGDALAAGEEGAGDLLQINLEAVDALYADDLKQYLGKLKEVLKEDLAAMRPETDQKLEPAGPGWVVEVRGFTYNKNGRQFVLDTLVENLAREGAKPTKHADAGGKPPKPEGGAKTAAKPAVPADPVVGRVSHVVLRLYNSQPVAVMAGKFDYIDKTWLPELLAPGRAARTPPGGQPTPPPGGRTPDAPTERPRERWVPLGTGSLNSGLTPDDPGVGRRPGPGPGVEPPPATTGPTEIKTEFVILFIWKEAVPSSPVEDPKKASGATATPTGTGRPSATAPSGPASTAPSGPAPTAPTP